MVSRWTVSWKDFFVQKTPLLAGIQVQVTKQNFRLRRGNFSLTGIPSFKQTTNPEVNNNPRGPKLLFLILPGWRDVTNWWLDTPTYFPTALLAKLGSDSLIFLLLLDSTYWHKDCIWALDQATFSTSWLSELLFLKVMRHWMVSPPRKIPWPLSSAVISISSKLLLFISVLKCQFWKELFSFLFFYFASPTSELKGCGRFLRVGLCQWRCNKKKGSLGSSGMWRMFWPRTRMGMKRCYILSKETTLRSHVSLVLDFKWNEDSNDQIHIGLEKSLFSLFSWGCM